MPLKPGCSLMQSIYKGQCLIKDKDNKLHCHGEVMTFADMSLFTLKCFSLQNTELRQLLGGCTFLEAFFFSPARHIAHLKHSLPKNVHKLQCHTE